LQVIARMRAAGMPLADIKLALRVLDGRAYGVDVEGVDRVLGLCQSIRARLAIAEELLAALRRRALDRQAGTSSPRS
jgi:DNA-binding transcriptional MerR regulator